MNPEKKLRIFGYIVYQDGVGYYRMAEPLRVIKEQGLAEVITNPFSPYGKIKDYWCNLDPDKNGMPKNAKPLANVLGDPKKPFVDAILMQRHDSAAMFSTALGLQKIYKIPVIQETDDYLYDIPETNPGKQSYHETPVERQNNPHDATTWQRRSLGNYDSYIVSTPFLEKYYENYSPTYLCPNSLDLRKRQFGPRKGHDESKEFRLGFSASGGHMEGLWLLEPVLDYLMPKHKNLVFYYYKGLFDIFKDKPYKNRIKKLPWAKLEDYPKFLHKMDFDVALAPLKDRLFNRGKSNLRLLEYWSSGKYPVIASPIGHYTETIKDGKNGLLAYETSDWIQNIELLMENKSLRKKLGEEGYKTVEKDFNLEKNAKLWVTAIRQSIKNYSFDKTAPQQYLAPDFRS